MFFYKIINKLIKITFNFQIAVDLETESRDSNHYLDDMVSM